MTVRIKFDLKFSISEDSSGRRELGQADPWYGVTDAIDDGGTFRMLVPAGTSNMAVSIQSLTQLNWLAIKSDQTITFRKNSTSGEPTTLQALGTGAPDAFMIMTTAGITSLYLSNAGSIDAEVVVSMAGVDPA